MIPDTHQDLLAGPVYVVLITIMPDGQPQATPVWANFDGMRIWVNSAKGRQKDRNMRANPRVTIIALDPQNPFRWIEVRGEVDEITEDGAVDHINALSALYTGNPDFYNYSPGNKDRETRVIYKIKPTKVNAMG